MIAQFLCIATANEGSKVIKVLEDYKKDSGQKLNKEKNSSFFSKSTKWEVQEEVKEMFRFQIIQQHEKYLGLPSLVGKGKMKAFNQIKGHVGRKIVRLKRKLLSRQDGKFSLRWWLKPPLHTPWVVSTSRTLFAKN